MQWLFILIIVLIQLLILSWSCVQATKVSLTGTLTTKFRKKKNSSFDVTSYINSNAGETSNATSSNKANEASSNKENATSSTKADEASSNKANEDPISGNPISGNPLVVTLLVVTLLVVTRLTITRMKKSTLMIRILSMDAVA